MTRAAAAAALALLCGCARTRPAAGDPLAGRPYEVRASPRHDAAKPAPVVFLLHGYGGAPETLDRAFGFTTALSERGWLLVLPRGRADREGALYWNATEACCDRDSSGVDDLAYLDAVYDAVARRYAVDPSRVYAVGYSNGGFLAHRLACDRADRFRAVVSVAGTGFENAARCRPSKSVAVLQVHGDQDNVVLFGGGGGVLGSGLAAYPAARTPLERWATHNGCADHRLPPERLDVSVATPGGETRVEQWAGCGSPVELWTVEDGTHRIPFAPGFGGAVLDFLARAGGTPR